MPLPPRPPPRFVPTLTEVVQIPDAAHAPAHAPALPSVTGTGPQRTAIIASPVVAKTPPLPAALSEPAGPALPPGLERQIPVATPIEHRAAVPPWGTGQPLASTSVQTSALPPGHLPASASPLRMPGAAKVPVKASPNTVVDPDPARPPTAFFTTPAALTESVRGRSMPEGMEEYMVHRVMQRVDVVLDQRLREVIATVVQEQTRSLLPRLREEIESVVRHSVYEAVSDELASGNPPATQG